MQAMGAPREPAAGRARIVKCGSAGSNRSGRQRDARGLVRIARQSLMSSTASDPVSSVRSRRVPPSTGTTCEPSIPAIGWSRSGAREVVTSQTSIRKLLGGGGGPGRRMIGTLVGVGTAGGGGGDGRRSRRGTAMGCAGGQARRSTSRRAAARPARGGRGKTRCVPSRWRRQRLRRRHIQVGAARREARATILINGEMSARNPGRRDARRLPAPAIQSPPMGKKLTHLDDAGRAKMVDVGTKAVTARRAMAEAFVLLLPETVRAIAEERVPNGAVRAVDGA